MRRSRALLVPALALLAACAGARARWHDAGLPNVPTPTFGGLQVWADVRWRDGWRVQRHVWTGHHRLLDAAGVRRAWGGLDACESALEDGVAPVETPRLAVLVHGLARTRHSLAGVAEELEAAGVRCVRVSTASTRRAPAEAAADLAALLDHVHGLEHVVFVTHSLGGIVVRELLARDDPWRSRVTVEDAVLIAPPSSGAGLARELRETPVVGPAAKLVLGDAFTVLAGPRAEVAPPWPADVPALIVAGSRGKRFGWNPHAPGDDDGVVGVRETALPGCDHLVVRGVHTTLMNHAEVRERIVARLGPRPAPRSGAAPRCGQSR